MMPIHFMPVFIDRLLDPIYLGMRLLISSTCLSLIACTSTPLPPPSQANSTNTKVDIYKGRYTTGCFELMPSLYYVEALEVEPISNLKAQAQYTKVFFGEEKCTVSSQLVQLRLPPTMWEFIGKSTANGKTADLIKITFAEGFVTPKIINNSQVKETADILRISFGTAGYSIPITKKTPYIEQNELSLLEEGKLFFSEPKTALDANGFPTVLQSHHHYVRQ